MTKFVAVLVIVLALLSGCATAPPTLDAPVSLPAHFEEIWYRPSLEKPGFFVATDTGAVTVATNSVTFIGEKGSTNINYEKIQSLSFGKVQGDVFNDWVTVKFRDGDIDLYALLASGKGLGWGGGGVAARIFQTIKFALDQKGLGSVVEQK